MGLYAIDYSISMRANLCAACGLPSPENDLPLSPREIEELARASGVSERQLFEIDLRWQIDIVTRRLQRLGALA